MTYRTSEDFAQETSPFRRFVRGMIRRVAVTLTQTARWQVLGQRGGQGGDETDEVEPFTGIGFYSRPPRSGNPEAVTAAIGGSKTRAIIATRDEATRQAAVGNLEEGETAVYNDQAVIVVKADGTVEIRLVGGLAVALATKADIDALKSWAATHIHNVPGVTAGGATVPSLVPTLAPPNATGTTVLLAQ